MRREHLLLDPADGKHLAPQRDLPGHGEIAPDRPAGGERGQGCHDGHSRRRSVLGNGPRGHVHVDRPVLEELGIDVERLGIGPHVGDGGLRALAHHVAEHPGEDEMLLAARHHRDLDEQDIAAHGRPG